MQGSQWAAGWTTQQFALVTKKVKSVLSCFSKGKANRLWDVIFRSFWPFWDLVGSTVFSHRLSSTHSCPEWEGCGCSTVPMDDCQVGRGPGAHELCLGKAWEKNWRRTKGDPAALYSCLLGGYREDWAKFLSKVCCERSANGHKLKNRHFQEGLGKSFSTSWVVTLEQAAQKGCEIALELFSIWLAKPWSSLL